MLEPVPCSLAELLKLLTSTSPLVNPPTVRLITATPYGFWSPAAAPVVGGRAGGGEYNRQ
jgi:hypothetical protein